MLAHLTHRTFVTPDHLSTELGHLEGTASVSDFYCFGDVGRWVPVVSMQRYLDDRRVVMVAAGAPFTGTPRAFQALDATPRSGMVSSAGQRSAAALASSQSL